MAQICRFISNTFIAEQSLVAVYNMQAAEHCILIHYRYKRYANRQRPHSTM